MKRITLNINELIKIKTDLEESLSAWNLLLNRFVADSCDEYWGFISDIQDPVEESLERIILILQLVKIQSGVKNALKKLERNELMEYIGDNYLDVLVNRDKSDEKLRKEIIKALIGDLFIDGQ
jgi:hypothetical protein